MSSSPPALDEPVFPNSPIHNFSPRKLLIYLTTIVFIAETIAMIVLYFLNLTNYLVSTLLDGAIMLALIFPALYVLQLKPLLTQMEVRLKTEQALRTSESQLKRVMEALPVGVWIIDKEGNVTHGNAASQNIWAGARYVGMGDYAEYKGWWADTGERIQSDEWAAARAIRNHQTILNEEINIEAFDGTLKIILNSAVPILDEANTIQGAVVVNQDITRRRSIENELVRTNELLGKLINSIHVLVAFMDRDFNFIHVNEAYAKAAGHPIDYFIGKNHFGLYPDAENQATFQQVVDTGEPFIIFEKPFEYAEYPERGVTYWDWSLQPVKGANEKVEGLIFSLLDVTERKKGEIQLARQNQELQELTNTERKQRELAEGLVQSAMVVSSSLQLDEVLDTILEQIYRAIPFQLANIALLENKTIRIVGFRSTESYQESVVVTEKQYLLDDFPLLVQAFSTQQPVFTKDTRNSTEWIKVPTMEWVLSFAVTPLMVREQVIGFINLNSDQPGFFNEEITAHLQAFAVPAALAIQNARLYKIESHARQVAETLSIAAQDLTKTLDLEQVIDTLLDHTREIIPSDTAGVTLLEDEKYLTLHAGRGYGSWANRDPIPTLPIEGITDSVIHRMVAARRSFILPNTNYDSAQKEQAASQSIRNWLVIPIIASDKIIGLVELGRVSEEFLSADLIQWAEALVGQAAVAIQNAWLFQQVRSSSERLQNLTRTLVELQENERAHIARELHDEAGQALSLLKLSLGRLQQDPECPAQVVHRIEELKGVTDGVLEELHRLAVDLRPIALDHLGLVVALEQYAMEIKSDQLGVQFKALGFEGGRLPEDIETNLYRIVQEALANVVRHAQASSVGILLEHKAGLVKLFIEDDGVGFNPDLPENRHSMGLIGMRERAEMFGGSLTIESSPGKGTSIIVEVPDGDTHPYIR